MKISTFIVAAILPASLAGQAAASTTASDLMAKEECPVAVAHYRSAPDTQERTGVIVAVWRDGTIVRAARADKSWEKHVVGTLEAKDRQALSALLERGDIWLAPRGEVAADSPQTWVVLQHGDRRWAWWESPGLTRTRELQETAQKLFHFHIQSQSDLVGSFERSWSCLNGRLEH
jgi:hypothetical protein